MHDLTNCVLQAGTEIVDENGNWTVDNCRQRLNQFCQTHNIPCDVLYAEEGAPGSRVKYQQYSYTTVEPYRTVFIHFQTYTASLNLKVKHDDQVDEKQLTAVSTATTKKAAAQGCALQLLSQLYKLTLVEANSGSGLSSKKKQSKGRLMVRLLIYSVRDCTACSVALTHIGKARAKVQN